MELINEGGRVTRRESLKRAAGAFMILPAGLARGYAANEKLNLGMIGVAGMGGVDSKTFSVLGENIAALCDVDSAVLEKRGAEYPKARKYTDFRKMIETEKLDGVSIAVPDHSHAYISVWAMKQGLHVYCQKPLCQSVHEARVMARVAAETKVITQMGTASSASESNLRTVEMIQSGAVGEITEVHLATDRPIWPQGYERLQREDDVPSTFDWDMWLGTAAVRAYQAKWSEGHPVYSSAKKKQFFGGGTVYHPFVWRGWIDFGSGALGDIAPHQMNVIFMALDLGAPSAVEVVETSGMKREMYPDWSIIRFDFAARGVHPPLKIFWYDGGKRPPEEISGPPRRPSTTPAPLSGRDAAGFRAAESQAPAAARAAAPVRPFPQGGGGVIWIGTKGSLPVGRGPYFGTQKEPYSTPPERQWGREEVHKDWAAAVKAGKQAPCHFGYAGPFTEAYQLGNIALRVGHRIEWDPLAFRITNCREANLYLTRAYRRGWDLREIAGNAAWNVGQRRA